MNYLTCNSGGRQRQERRAVSYLKHITQQRTYQTGDGELRVEQDTAKRARTPSLKEPLLQNSAVARSQIKLSHRNARAHTHTHTHTHTRARARIHMKKKQTSTRTSRSKVREGERKRTASQHRLAEALQKHTHMSPLPTRDDHSDNQGEDMLTARDGAPVL